MNRLDELEKKLATEVAQVEISASVESALMKEFDRRRGRGVRVYLGAVTLLAACLLFALWPKSKPTPRPQPTAARAVAPAVTHEVKLASPPRPKRRGRSVARASVTEPEFLRIPYTEPLASYERAEIVRVEMPVSALSAAGFHIATADAGAKAQADLIVGEDGMAHAIRLISVSSN
jgi:hypothetical protein